jgi:hypothetical protein
MLAPIYTTHGKPHAINAMHSDGSQHTSRRHECPATQSKYPESVAMLSTDLDLPPAQHIPRRHRREGPWPSG